MPLSAKDFKTYLARVHDDEDKVLFQEAINAASSGAPRSAYIMVWLSAAESFKRRFKALSASDGNAKKIVGEVARREANEQSIDKYLLSSALDYGLISATEHTRLEHVYVMRCLFGHPYEEQPKPEELLDAASTVVDLVLSRPSKLRHGFIGRQIDMLTTNPTFLDDVELAAIRYATELRPKIADDLHAYTIEATLKLLEPLISDPARAPIARRVVWFVKAYVRADLAMLASWDIVSVVTRFPLAGSAALAETEFWPLMAEHAREIMVGELLTLGASAGAPLRALQQLDDAGKLSARERERLVEQLDSLKLPYLVTAGIHPRYLTRRLVEQLQSHDWYTQNPTIEILSNLGSERIAQLPTTDQRLLGNNVLQAAEGASTRANGFISAVATNAGSWPVDLVAGIIEECFVSDDNEVRFKLEAMQMALHSLTTMAEKDARAVLEALTERVRSGKCVDWSRSRKRDDAVKFVQAVNAPQIAPALAAFVDALNAVELPADDGWA